jgi:hypothetical protein
MRRSSLSALFILAGCIACSTGPDDDAPPAVEVSIVSVDLDAQVVSATMQNVGGQTLTFGPCSLGLESGKTGEWMWVPKDYACDTVQGFLEPGKSYKFDVVLPDGAAGCPLRVAVGLGVERVLDLTVTGHSSEFCPEPG